MNVPETKEVLRTALEAASRMYNRVVVSLTEHPSGGTEVSIETWGKYPQLSRDDIAHALLDALPYSGATLYAGAGQYLVNIDAECPSPSTICRAAAELAVELSERLFDERTEFLTISTHASLEGSGIEVSR